MFLQLIMDGAYPDERRALAALDAAHCVCDVAGLPAFMAWRDHVVLQDWNNRGHPAGMVAPAEETGADVWEGALTAARHALKLPPCAALEIQVVMVPGMSGMAQQHGPNRYVWRRAHASAAMRCKQGKP